VGAMTREFNWRGQIENYRYLPADIFNQIRDVTWQGQTLKGDCSGDVPEDHPAFMQEPEECSMSLRRVAQRILRNPNISFAEDGLVRVSAVTLNHEVARLAAILRCGILELGHLLNQLGELPRRVREDGPQLKVATPDEHLEQ
jgi:hypothetical protein